MTSLVGQRLGGYELETELGRGTMGVVYQARHAESGKTFAVKVLIHALAADITFVTRFMREAAVASQLQHPNIVRVYESGRQESNIYFVMEYFEGMTVGRILRERKRLPAAEVIEIAAQAADALAYAHSEGRLVHRDVKPENMQVDRWRRVKLLDFGLARIEGMEAITKAGTVVGSLYYVSPEQLLGHKLDGRTDVYALGVSMYEMLTGRRPYRGQTLTEMSDAILYAAAPSLRQLEPSAPSELERIVARAMARDLNQRYASATELHTELRVLQAAMAAQGALGALGAPGAPMADAQAVGRGYYPSGGPTAGQGFAPGQSLNRGEVQAPRTHRATFRPASLEPTSREWRGPFPGEGEGE